MVAGATQSLIGGSLSKLWNGATGVPGENGIAGWTVYNTTGMNRVVTFFWEGMFAGGISFSTGTMTSIAVNEILSSPEISDDNAVKE